MDAKLLDYGQNLDSRSIFGMVSGIFQKSTGAKTCGFKIDRCHGTLGTHAKDAPVSEKWKLKQVYLKLRMSFQLLHFKIPIPFEEEVHTTFQ